ncbi:hypothetical protein V8F20_005983 [Naviculisporaceae sp. PSN 640]
MAEMNAALNGTNDALFPQITTLQDLPTVLRNFTWLDCDPQQNCTLASSCLSEELSNDDLSTSSSYVLVEFTRTCAPEIFTNLSYEQILGWNSFMVINHNISALNLTDQVNEKCHKEFCQNLDWEGDPDLSGPGVMAAYLIQAVLTTAFSLFYVLLEIVRWIFRRRNRRDLSLNQLPGFFQSSLPHITRCLDSLWISSLYFGVAISSASLAIIINSIALGGPQISRYVMSLAFLGTIFSWAATLTLVPWCTRGGNRQFPGGVIPVAIFLMSSCGSVLFTVVWHTASTADPTPYAPAGSAFETYCLAPLGAYESFNTFMIPTVSCVAAEWFLVAVCAIHEAQWPRKVLSLLKMTRYAIAFCSFILMWASLGFLRRLRFESSGLSDTGKLEDNRWGFGQVVAVVGWLPMAVEIVTVTRDILLRRFRVWRKKYIRQHVESAGTDLDDASTPSENREETETGRKEVQVKKVKTW